MVLGKKKSDGLMLTELNIDQLNDLKKACFKTLEGFPQKSGRPINSPSFAPKPIPRPLARDTPVGPRGPAPDPPNHPPCPGGGVFGVKKNPDQAPGVTHLVGRAHLEVLHAHLQDAPAPEGERVAADAHRIGGLAEVRARVGA